MSDRHLVITSITNEALVKIMRGGAFRLPPQVAGGAQLRDVRLNFDNQSLEMVFFACDLPAVIEGNWIPRAPMITTDDIEVIEL